VITVVEKELGFAEGKLLHKLCQVITYYWFLYDNFCSIFILFGNKIK